MERNLRSEFVFRPVRDSDSEALIQLIGSCYAEYPGCILDVEREEQWLKAPASYYEQKKISGAFWVLELDAKVYGCIGIKFHEFGLAEPKTLYVPKHARCRGIATFLMGVMEGYAKLHGVKRLEFWSDTRFTDAHHLYVGRLGYTKTGKTRTLNDASNSIEFHFTKTF